MWAHVCCLSSKRLKNHAQCLGEFPVDNISLYLFVSIRVIVRSPDHYVHGVLLPSNLSADRYNKDDIVASLGKEMKFTSSFKFADKPELSEEIMKLDEVKFLETKHFI